MRKTNRSDDGKADWLRERVVGDEPANVSYAPHDSRREARQDHRRVNTRPIPHCSGVDEQIDCAGC